MPERRWEQGRGFLEVETHLYLFFRHAMKR
jgi:hypothetical protein